MGGAGPSYPAAPYKTPRTSSSPCPEAILSPLTGAPDAEPHPIPTPASFSFELFPPKTPEGMTKLAASIDR